MGSVWMAGAAPGPAFPALRGEAAADVVVVGGGITGVMTALRLSEAGLKVVLLEARDIGGGNTGLSTGNLYALVSSGLHALARRWRDGEVREVVRLRAEAVDAIERLARLHAPDCGFARCPARIVVEREDADALESLQAEFEACREAGLAPGWDAAPPLPFPVARGLVVEGQAQFNPYLFVRGLAEALATRAAVHEDSPVTGLDASPGSVETPQGRVAARHIVLATHTPPGFNLVQAEMEVHREYGIAAPTDRPLPPGIHWVRDAGRSLRPYARDGRDWLVVVGEKHKTGEAEPGVRYRQRLLDYAAPRLGVQAPAFGWSAQQFQPADGLPYIGPSAHGNVWIATGFAADGLTWGAVAARLIADGILGQESEAARLLTPRRFTPLKSAPTWGRENAAVVRHLVADRLRDGEAARFADVPPGEGRLVEVDGRKYAVHRTDAGALRVLSPVCPHLKCIVQWNANERSWDCPCHGSRFDAEGQVLDGPALTPLERYELD